MDDLLVSLFRDHYDAHVHEMHLESFDDDMLAAVRELGEIQLGEELGQDDLYHALDLLRLMVPCRTSHWAAPHDAADALAALQSVPQLVQRSPEWYAFRHTLVTASAIHKAHGSPAKRNELIVEKCDPTLAVQSLSMEGARHWGVKYEAVSVLYYTHTYPTQVAEFGCLRHPTVPFLGASPDGINVDPTSERFGRMLEIKNPVSREITGVPKQEYWIQVQVQMAVCGLKSCDFLETQFVEYASRAEFDADGLFETSADGKHKGIVLCVAKESVTSYLYPPYQCSADAYEVWEAEQLNEYEWLSTLYWKLEDVLCTLIEYNDAWFQASLPLYQDLWAIIELERESGAWRERLPKKRLAKISV
jgi:putative phage-type endonuclease